MYLADFCFVTFVSFSVFQVIDLIFIILFILLINVVLWYVAFGLLCRSLFIEVEVCLVFLPLLLCVLAPCLHRLLPFVSFWLSNLKLSRLSLVWFLSVFMSPWLVSPVVNCVKLCFSMCVHNAIFLFVLCCVGCVASSPFWLFIMNPGFWGSLFPRWGNRRERASSLAEWSQTFNPSSQHFSPKL